MKILRADSWRRPHYTNGQWRNALEPRQRKRKCSVLKQLKTLKKSLVIYPTTVCVAFIAWYCPPGRSCNPWWNRGLADIDTTRHNEHPGVRLQIVLIGSWHPGAGTIVFSSFRPGLSHAFGGLCPASLQEEDCGIGKVNQKFKLNTNLMENISL